MDNCNSACSLFESDWAEGLGIPNKSDAYTSATVDVLSTVRWNLLRMDGEEKGRLGGVEE